jgi:hypothetical protein
MDIGSLLLSLALLLLVGFIVARPILERRGAREKEISRADQLAAERESLLTALRDLDFDHATGKIGDEDYAPQRAQLVAQGVAVLKQLDGVLSKSKEAFSPAAGEGTVSAEDEIERAIAARRKTQAAPNAADQIEAEVAARRKPAPTANAVTCPHCGAAAKPGDRFCPKCGQTLALTCANCGAPAHPGDQFCATCGTKLQPVGAAG